MRIRIATRPGSRGAQELSAALYPVARRLRPNENSRYRPRQGDVILNWGKTALLDYAPAQVVNHPAVVAQAVNKLQAFNRLLAAGVSIPPYTTDIAVARQWIQDRQTVLCRTLLRASGGRGIVLADTEDQLVPAPLYVQYKKKIAEYRIHVFFGTNIDTQQKMIRRGTGDTVDYRIRNHDNGWIFAREAAETPNEQVVAQAIMAVDALGLDFGAADVIWNQREQRAYVLEVNTAPGLEGTTVESYSTAIRQHFNIN